MINDLNPNISVKQNKSCLGKSIEEKFEQRVKNTNTKVSGEKY